MSSNLSIKKIAPNNEDELFGVKERPNMLRDSHSNALFMVDEEAILRHEAKKKKKQDEEAQKQKVDKIENDLDEVKRLLSVLINKVDNK
jgi:hypothetical protein